VLVCHPEDLRWFSDTRVLPELTRTSGAGTDHRTLQLVTSPSLHPGLAFLDAPDIDSVVAANRRLAAQLLAAADLWLFVTTAARYADAVPWDVLETAHERGTALAVLLDRVPSGAEDDIAAHLRQMLAAHGLAAAPLFVVAETTLQDGLLPEPVGRRCATGSPTSPATPRNGPRSCGAPSTARWTACARAPPGSPLRRTRS
jgi:hypothetical protein